MPTSHGAFNRMAGSNLAIKYEMICSETGEPADPTDRFALFRNAAPLSGVGGVELPITRIKTMPQEPRSTSRRDSVAPSRTEPRPQSSGPDEQPELAGAHITPPFEPAPRRRSIAVAVAVATIVILAVVLFFALGMAIDDPAPSAPAGTEEPVPAD